MNDETVVELDIAISRGEVLRFLGYPHDRVPRARVAALLDEEIGEARTLVRPRGATVQLPLARAADVGLSPLEARGLAVGLVTIGPGLEDRVSELSAAGEQARAVILDAAGSAAVEAAADHLGALLASPRAMQGPGETPPASARDLPCRLSPGYGRWPLDAQRRLFAVLPHADVGVTLLPSLMMVPRKSISFAMWLGAATPPAEGRAGCVDCPLPRCQYRRAPVRRKS